MQLRVEKFFHLQDGAGDGFRDKRLTSVRLNLILINFCSHFFAQGFFDVAFPGDVFSGVVVIVVDLERRHSSINMNFDATENGLLQWVCCRSSSSNKAFSFQSGGYRIEYLRGV